MAPAMRMITVLNLMLLLGLGSASASSQPPPVWVEREAWLMGTTLHVRVAADDRASGIHAIEAAFREVRRLEGVLSTWTNESEISRVNRAAAGEEVLVSPELMHLLSEAAGWSSRTDGAFDPAVGALIDAWDLRGAGRQPTHRALAEALHATGVARFDLDGAGSRVRVPGRGAWLDTGGFGKGAALRAAERVLREHGVKSALLDFGGQVLALGVPTAEEVGWEIGVAHPSSRATEIAKIRVPSGYSVATTSQSERFVEVDGDRFGHVLDPRTGLPVPAWGSVTVVAPDPVTADVLSTALFVMGPEAGRRWAAERVEGVLFLEVWCGEVEASWNEPFERYRINQPVTEGS